MDERYERSEKHVILRREEEGMALKCVTLVECFQVALHRTSTMTVHGEIRTLQT